MITRFWILLLAVLLGIASSVAWMTRSSATRQASFALSDSLQRDRIEMELWLKLDARMRLDAIAPIAAQPQVIRALRASASNRRELDKATSEKLATSLRKLNKQLQELEGEVLFVVDANGKRVADIDSKKSKSHSFGRVPLVADAIRGYQRDGVWTLDGVPYRMAARPVIDSGQYVGALVHGTRFDATLARRLADRLGGVTVSFFVDDETKATGSSDGANLQADAINVGLKTALENETLAQGRPTTPIAVPGGSALYSLLAGTGTNTKIGYAIGRNAPTKHEGLFGNPTQQDVASIDWLPIAGIPFLLGIAGLLLMYFERDRPLRALLTGTEAIRQGAAPTLPLKGLRGKHKRLANGINALASGDNKNDGASAAELNEILRVTRENSDDVKPYVDFVEENQPSAGRITPLKPGPMPARAVTPVAPPPPPSLAEPKSAAASHALFDNDEDEATMIAEIPQELIDAANAQLAASREKKATSEEEQHFREMFEQFVATQKECGEEEIPFAKFASKLRATRDQILKNHDATGVRFTVYVKDSKAALKANLVHG